MLDFCGGSIKSLRRAAGVPKGSGKSTKRDALIADIDAGGFKRPKNGAKRIDQAAEAYLEFVSKNRHIINNPRMRRRV